MEQDEPKSPQRSEMDFQISRWHLIILFCTGLGTIIEGLIPHSFGTFIANFRSALNKSQSLEVSDLSFIKASQFELNWLPALSSALPCILLPLFSMLINKIKLYFQPVSIFSFIIVCFSCILSSFVSEWSLLFLTYSFIYSVGTSLFLAIVIAIIPDYFPINHRCHVLATSFYQMGYPISASIGNPISASLIVQFGWRNTFRYIALIQVIIGAIIGFCMKPLNKVLCCSRRYTEDIQDYGELINKTKESDQSKFTILQIMQNYQLWTWMIGKYINYMCWYGLRTNIVTYLVKSTHFGLQLSASLMSVYAASEIIVAILASIVGDYLRGWLIHVHIIAALSMAILTGIYTVVLSNYLSGILLMVFIGMGVQFSLSFGFPASVEVLNSDFDMKTGWILTNVAAGLGILTSPLLSGLIMDNFHLDTLFYVQCLGWILQTIFFLLTVILTKLKEMKSTAVYDPL